jgi:ribosomal 50S subunit-recycling heat shock protein
MKDFIPPQPPKSVRITLNLQNSENRLDSILLRAIKEQSENEKLKAVSRAKYKELFRSGKILIKGQRAHPSSAVAKGTTYVDILGFS